MERLRPAIAIAILMAYTLLGAVGASGVVLCVGADGHVALESAVDGRCQGEAAAAAVPLERATLARAAATPLSHCGACVDLPLALCAKDQEPPRPPSRSTHGVPLDWPEPVGLAEQLLATARGPTAHDRAPLPAATLRCLRSVVLVI